MYIIVCSVTNKNPTVVGPCVNDLSFPKFCLQASSLLGRVRQFVRLVPRGITSFTLRQWVVADNGHFEDSIWINNKDSTSNSFPPPTHCIGLDDFLGEGRRALGISFRQVRDASKPCECTLSTDAARTSGVHAAKVS